MHALQDLSRFNQYFIDKEEEAVIRSQVLADQVQQAGSDPEQVSESTAPRCAQEPRAKECGSGSGTPTWHPYVAGASAPHRSMRQLPKAVPLPAGTQSLAAGMECNAVMDNAGWVVARKPLPSNAQSTIVLIPG